MQRHIDELKQIESLLTKLGREITRSGSQLGRQAQELSFRLRKVVDALSVGPLYGEAEVKPDAGKVVTEKPAKKQPRRQVPAFNRLIQEAM